jgi:hypothetical protein
MIRRYRAVHYTEMGSLQLQKFNNFVMDKARVSIKLSLSFKPSDWTIAFDGLAG